MPPLDDVFFVLAKPCMSCYNIDNQYEKDVKYQQVPMVKQHLSEGTPRDFFRVVQQLEEPYSKMPPEEAECDNVNEVEENGYCISYQIDEVKKLLRKRTEDFP